MTENTSTYAGYAPPPAGMSPGQNTDDASMKDKASESAQAGKQAATDVAQTAAGHAKDVVGEAQSQARNLVGEARDQLRSHVGDQHRTAVSNLRSLGDELRSMAGSSEQNGMASDLVSQAADRTQGVADWLDGRQPADLIDELRTFARRRPGAFLLGALAAGVVAGRLTRGAVAAHSDDSGSESTPAHAAGNGAYGNQLPSNGAFTTGPAVGGLAGTDPVGTGSAVGGVAGTDPAAPTTVIGGVPGVQRTGAV